MRNSEAATDDGFTDEWRLRRTSQLSPYIQTRRCRDGLVRGVPKHYDELRETTLWLADEVSLTGAAQN